MQIFRIPSLLAAVIIIRLLFEATAQAEMEFNTDYTYVISYPNCEDEGSLQMFENALVVDDADMFREALKQDGCYAGGNINIVRQTREPFSAGFYNNLVIVEAIRRDNKKAVYVLLNADYDLTTLEAYNLSNSIAQGQQMKSFAYCYSRDAGVDVLRIVAKSHIDGLEPLIRLAVSGLCVLQGTQIIGKIGEVEPLLESDIQEGDLISVGVPTTAYDGNVWNMVNTTLENGENVYSFTSYTVITVEKYAELEALVAAQEVSSVPFLQ